ncbi:FKBP-type peptidyl-prolyl cis-trans isomerase [Amnibacterium sp. CER49]|uniref:FKBP-type peptidyl-prolyl cis-trans isomerase n=1 Tax=Amnibacterium sp. CER49 TaxID=3039161 RepID=UPI0024487A35|nr:FKBP-type peptidyl-prolyl cis-trans isomerase [Amnibacterium sp. CER49]MDH2444640.1 FKBP-type peptidyl-prolyl cis-trans isomerase [Amnibacterium sp. CER49]
MLRLPVLRLAASLATAVVLATGLAGCAAGAGASGCTPQATSGSGSDSVIASGPFGTAPAVRFATPLDVSTTQVTTLRPGSGAPVVPNQELLADVTILDGTTGRVVTKTDYSGKVDASGSTGPATIVVNSTLPSAGLRKALVCAQQGERLAAVLPPKEGFAAGALGTSVRPTDSLVVVVDVRRTYLPRANGVNQVMGSGLPAVVLGPDGRPGITVPPSDPPKQLVVADLKKGSGAVIRKGDTAVVHYTGVLWKGGTVFDSSWQKGAPAALPVKNGSLVKGFVTALEGQRVGSQVIAILPPGEAYGAQGSGAVPGGATLVFVVDILGKV